MTPRPSLRAPVATLFLLSALLVLGGWFRVSHLGEKLLWHDEIATVHMAAGYSISEWKAALYTGEVLDVADVTRFQRLDRGRSVLDAVQELARHDPQHPPTYYLLAASWVRLVGEGIGRLRMLSVLASLLGLFAMYGLCWELSMSRRVAWTGTAALAVSPFFVLYAQEAREYSLWATVILASNAALLAAIRRTEASPGKIPAASWAGYGLLTVLSLYTSFSSAAVILGQVLFIILRERGRPNRVSLSAAGTLAISALGFLPWALNLARNYETFAVSMRWSKEIVIPTSSLLRILALNLSRPFIDFWADLETAPAWVGVLGAVALGVWAVAALVREAPTERVLLILCVLILPTAIHLVPDLLFGGIRSLSTRYLTPSLLMLLVAVAWLLGAPQRRPRVAAGLAAAVFAVMVASCWHNARQESVWTKGVSYSLPEVARIINASDRPLLVGGIEIHSPGNLLALSARLDPGTKMQFLRIEDERAYVLADHDGDIFLLGPNVLLRQRLEEREHVRFELLVEDLFLQLWKAHPAGEPADR